MRRCVWSRNLKNEEVLTRVGPQRHKKTKQKYMYIYIYIYKFRGSLPHPQEKCWVRMCQYPCKTVCNAWWDTKHVYPKTVLSSGSWTTQQIFTMCRTEYNTTNICNDFSVFFFHVASAPSGPGPPHYRGFTITFRHTILGGTPLDEWSARRRDLYLTPHITHKRQTSMPPAEFKPAIPASERPQTHAVDRAATGIGICND